MKVVYLMLPIYWDTRFNYISEESTFGAVLQSNPHHYSPESEPEEIDEGSWCWYWGNNVQNVDPDHFISDESTFCIDVNSEPDHRKLYSDFAEASKFVDEHYTFCSGVNSNPEPEKSHIEEGIWCVMLNFVT